ncbi:MAG TPA: RidA family protein [Myxococcaceae bacterium]|nr:RidA family protein [Myxococcaceae bacterium]
MSPRGDDKSRVVQPLGWMKPSGYANGIVAEGRWLFVAGQIGWDPRQKNGRVAKGFVPQFERALDNLLEVLREAGGGPSDLVRLTIYVVDKKEYIAARKQIGEAWIRRVGRHYPAMSLIEVSGLLEPSARVEIEGTAVL